MIIVDTNVIAATVLDGDRTATAKRLYGGSPDWCAPSIWRNELRNVVVRHCRAGRLEWDAAADLIVLAEQEVVDGDRAIDSAAIIEFARSSGCTAYDSEFAVLAVGLDLPLLTWDGELLRALPGRAVTPEEYLASR